MCVRDSGVICGDLRSPRSEEMGLLRKTWGLLFGRQTPQDGAAVEQQDELLKGYCSFFTLVQGRDKISLKTNNMLETTSKLPP